MFPNVSLTQLRCFQAVARHGSFTAAAGQLCLSQSAVSQAVTLLERTLGTPLLLRTRDGVVPTAVGRVALEEARTALTAIERLAAIDRAPHLVGTVKVGAVQSAAVHLLPGWMLRLRSEQPGIAVSLFEGTDTEIIAWLLAGIVDVGITSRTHPALPARPAHRDAYVVLAPASHVLAGRTVLHLADLDRHRMLMSGGGCETLIEELLAAADSHPTIVCIVRDNETLASMVRQGLGLTIMPELALPADRAGLAIVPLRPVLPRTLHLVSPAADQRGPAATAFLTVASGIPDLNQKT